MLNLVLKIIICPLTIYIADMLSPQINFYLLMDIIIIGLIVALVGYIGDSFLLKKISNFTLTWIDVILSTLVIWISSWFFTTAQITFSGSLFTGILLGFTEYLSHRMLLSSQRIEFV